MIHACYSGACPWESSWTGECRKPRRIPCPELIDEDDEEAQEEYENAVIEWEEHRSII